MATYWSDALEAIGLPSSHDSSPLGVIRGHATEQNLLAQVLVSSNAISSCRRVKTTQVLISPASKAHLPNLWGSLVYTLHIH